MRQVQVITFLLSIYGLLGISNSVKETLGKDRHHVTSTKHHHFYSQPLSDSKLTNTIEQMSLQLYNINSRSMHHSTSACTLKKTGINNIDIAKDKALMFVQFVFILFFAGSSEFHPLNCRNSLNEETFPSGFYRIFPWKNSTLADVLCDKKAVGKREKVKVNPLSDVAFSQDSIRNTFKEGILKDMLIGTVLDSILEGNKTYLEFILNMEEAVYRKPYKYYARNNRSLWVLKQLSLNNYAEEFEIWRSNWKIKRGRFTTSNDGKKILIRGNPGGKYTKRGEFWDIATQSYLVTFTERKGYKDESDDEY